MTQKELLYVEDAICHEKNILAYLENMLEQLDDEDIEDIVNEHIQNHQNLKDDLMNVLKEEVHE